MAQYFLSAREPSGKKVTELIEAPSPAEAIQALEKRGYECVVLHTDDFVAQVIRPTDSQTARDLHRNRYRSSIRRTLVLALRTYGAMWKTVALTVSVFVLRRAMNAPWHAFDGVLVAVLLVPPVWARLTRSAVIGFHRLLEAESWYRWQDAIQILSAIADKLPPYAAAWHRAKALAGLGRLDDAVAVFEPFSCSDALAPSRYWHMIATVYRIAERPELEIAAHEKALELSPNDPTMLLALANAMLDNQPDVRHAKGLMQRALQQPLGDMTRHGLMALEGRIALEEGNARLAVERLEEAHCEQRRLANGLPTAAAVADVLEGRLALAKALAGDLAAARRHLRRAEPRLRALKRQQQLLHRCQRAMGD